jgi:hypothetical protein
MNSIKFYTVLLCCLITINFSPIIHLGNQLKKTDNTIDNELCTGERFNHLITRARRDGIDKLPIGDCMGKIGENLIGIPYIGGTLEKESEQCTVDLAGLDCVTFFENSLNISRLLKIEMNNKNLDNDSLFPKLLEQVTFTRYRDGELDGYISRLHYTSEWIMNNVKKEVIKDMTKELGGKRFNLHVGFMSANPQYYPALVKDPTLTPKIAEIENRINAQEHWYIPSDQVKGIEDKLKTGDIIAIATNKSGLDYSHTGMIFKDEKGRALFMHASSLKKRVYKDRRISLFLSGNANSIGISVLRPLEPIK